MAHANARLTQHGRKLAVDRVLGGHKPGEVGKQLGVSRQTVYKWVRRFLAEGLAGLVDRSSRPHRLARLTPEPVVTSIVSLRLALYAGPVRLAAQLGLPASTVGAVLRREQLPRLSELDRVTGELIRSVRSSPVRYQHRSPGSLLHIDVKKLGRIPDGGGWRIHGREVTGPTQHRTSLGWDYIHVAIDDCTRLAYAETLPDERGETCAEFLHRAVAWFREHGVTIRRVLTDNALSYRRGSAWAAVCSVLQIRRRFTKPRHPWTNGKAERFNRTLQTEWAYSQAWTSNTERTAALAPWLEHYNTERAHTALAGATPISRLAA
jgi:transposase InsO family protein/transposase-like protein